MKPVNFHQQPRRGRWLVLIACCLSSFVTMGMAFSLGTVYLDIMDTFDTPRPLAALVQSLCLGVGFGAGIVTGPLLGRLGGAITLIHGGLTCSAGCIAGSLAPNIYVLIICVGCLSGLGVSSCYLASQVVVRSTFNKHRNLAISMVTMSTGAGMTTYPSLIRWMVDTYTLRGMFLIFGGICFHCVLFGMIVKTFGTSTGPSVKSLEMEESNKEKKYMTNRRVNDKDYDTSKFSPEGTTDDSIPSKTFKDQNLLAKERCSQGQPNKEISVENSLPSAASKNSRIDSKSLTKTREITAILAVIDVLTGKEDGKADGMDTVLTDQTANGKIHAKEASLKISQGLNNPRKSIVTISKDVEVLGSDNTELPSTKLNLKQGQRRTSGQRWRSSVSETFQTDLFHNTRYLIVTIFCYTCFLNMNSPYLFITDIGKGAGLNVEQGAQLLTVLAISNTVGRGAAGLLQVLCHISALNLFGIMLGCSGVALSGFVFLDYFGAGDVFTSHVCVCVVFGLFYGVSITSTSLSCLELVDAHQFAAALGYQFCIAGISYSLAGPLGGWIKDTTGSYNPIFCMALAQGLLAMTICLTINYCGRHLPGTRQKNAVNIEDNTVKENTLSHFNNAYSEDTVDVGFTEPENISTHL